MLSYHPSKSSNAIMLASTCLYLMFFLPSASPVGARDIRSRPWGNIPRSFVKRQPGHEFLDECQSLAAFLAQLRGGQQSPQDDYYYSSSPDRGRYERDNYERERDNYYDPDTWTDTKSKYRKDDEDDIEGEYYDDYMDDDRRRKGSRRATTSSLGESNVFSSIPSIIRDGDRRIGFGLLGSGLVFTLLGISLFFNKTLMRLGNLLFIAGVPMTLGPGRMAGYFLQPEKIRATGCLALGVFLVFIGWPVFGIILEIFGILNLFGNMFPVLLAIAKTMPVIGPILSGNTFNSNNNNRREYYSNNKPPRREEEYYYEDEPADNYYEPNDYRRRDDRDGNQDQQYYY